MSSPAADLAKKKKLKKKGRNNWELEIQNIRKVSFTNDLKRPGIVSFPSVRVDHFLWIQTSKRKSSRKFEQG